MIGTIYVGLTTYFIHPTEKRLFEGKISEIKDSEIEVTYKDIDFYTKEIIEKKVNLLRRELFLFDSDALESYLGDLRQAFITEYYNRHEIMNKKGELG